MAARFPQSGSSVAYQIKAAYSSKVKVLYWAASADSVHRLRSGDTASTIVTRSTSGAGFNADGRITGTNASTFFSDSETSSLTEQSDIAFGVFLYGDLFNGGVVNTILLGSATPPDMFDDGFKIKADGYGIGATLKGGGGDAGLQVGISDDVAARIDIGIRRAAADPTSTFRVWFNGSESTGDRATAAASGSGTAISNLYFGGSYAGTGNTSIQWEGCFFASGDLTDAELNAITNDPTTLIEVATVASVTPTIVNKLLSQSSVTASVATHNSRRFG